MPISDPRLHEMAGRLETGERITEDQVLHLYRTPDLAGVAALANRERQRQCGDEALYIVNRHINPTNLCVYRCSFCAFARRPGDPDAYELSLEQIQERAAAVAAAGATEVHVVGGLHPRWGLAEYEAILRTLRRCLPAVHLKALTAVEVAYLARRERRPIEETLQLLREAGMDSLPGGGAEILHPEIRRIICDAKHRAVDWLDVHRTAHGLGLRSTATMLYGHLERPEHRVHHLLQLRELQDETGGFLAYVPLRFHPEGTGLLAQGLLGSDWRPAGREEDLRELAVARLALDCIRNIKAYWIMIGLETAAESLAYGVNDLDGTVEEERIAHMAGAQTPQACTATQLRTLIRSAGRVPIERDSLYRRVHRAPDGGWSTEPRTATS
jgi:aminodeoxyfutalosine synthase